LCNAPGSYNDTMGTVEEFLRMGGYAAYVWPAFGITVVLMVGLFSWSRISLKAAQRTLDLLQNTRRARRRDLDTTTPESDA
jgi:heme exporter protein D